MGVVWHLAGGLRGRVDTCGVAVSAFTVVVVVVIWGRFCLDSGINSCRGYERHILCTVFLEGFSAGMAVGCICMLVPSTRV